MATVSPYFCVLPWYAQEFYLGVNSSPCCLLPPSYDLDQLRKDLLDGVASKYCQLCWKLESQNQPSRRTQENQLLDYKLNRDIESIEQDCRDGLNRPMMYQIYLSNLCNQACVTCGGQASTKWQQIENKITNKPIQIRRQELALLQIDYANAKRIYILGGEPLYDPDLVTVLQSLLDHGNRDCFISFTTNGSVVLSHQVRSLLSQFNHLNICISIDGIQSRFEYMRWPGKWSVLLENLKDYKDVTKNNISISYTVSSINAIYYSETVEWFEQQGLNYSHNLVTHPSWANLHRTPVEIKQQFTHGFFDQWKTVTGQEISLVHFADQLRNQDRLKSVAIHDYMPELARIIDGSP